MEKATLEQLIAGYGIRDSRDLSRVRNIPVTMNGETVHISEAEARKLRLQRNAEARNDRAKARAGEKADVEVITDARLKYAMRIVGELWFIIHEIAFMQSRRAQRKMGETPADEITSMAVETVRSKIAHSEFDLDTLMDEAHWLVAFAGKSRVPKDIDPEHFEAKVLAMWINNAVRANITRYHRDSPTFLSLDIVDTVVWNMAGEDEQIARFKADGGLGLLGARFRAPGTIDRDLLAQLITEKITAMSLDALTELLLNPDARRKDGKFKWTEYAEQVFTAVGWAYEWELLQRKTDSKELHGRYARGLARRAFVWLPVFMARCLAVMEKEGDKDLRRPQQVFPVEITVQAPNPEAMAKDLAGLVLEILEGV